MKKRFTAAVLLVAAVLGGIQQAYASCMKSAEDALWAVVSGGASYAACVTAELVTTIKSLIDTIGRLVENVRKNGMDVANAALGVVRAGVDEGRRALEGAQRSLASSTAQARQIATSATTVIRGTAVQVQAPAPAASASMTVQPLKPATPGSASTMIKPGAASLPGAVTPPTGAIRTAPALTVPADPAQMRAALSRAADKVGSLESEISREVASQVSAALQRAGQQAESHLSTAADVTRTLLEAPFLALQRSLNDMLSHPERLVDPSATINSQINIISNSIVDAMNRINDAITRDALATLGGVEADIHRAAANADRADKIVKAMEQLSRDQSQTALTNLESLTGAAAGSGMARAPIGAVPMAASFRVDAIRGRLNSATTPVITPLKTATDGLRSQLASIERPRPTAMDAQVKQQGEAEFDRLFANKSPDEVQRQKAELLAKARQRFANDPQLVAKIQQQLDQQIGVRVRTLPRPGIVSPTAAQPGSMRAPAQVR